MSNQSEHRRRDLGVRAGGALLAAALALLGACAPASPASAPTGAAPGQAAPAARGTLRLAVAGMDTNTYSVIYIADKEGYFQEQGLTLDVKEANPPVATQALIAGQFDLAHAASPGIAAALKGAPLKMIFVIAEPSPYWIIGKKDLKTWTDLKGKTIGVSSTTGTQVLDTSRVLALHGVNAQADGVNYVVPGGPGDEQKVAALRAGSIDAGVFASTGAVVATDDGFSLLGDMHAINTYDYTLWANNPTMTNKADLVRAFVTGTLKGLKIFKHDNAKAVEYVTQQLDGNRHWGEKVVELSAPWFTEDGLPTDAGLREAIRYKEEASGEPSTAGPDQWSALDFVRQANDELTRTGWKP
ncbi:MAG TPA: ABC transporter substrate-binding protein [Chloroflexota bacterium]|nr:ABC transporter substrate-binding protein [Chloroflexota bacterium]